MPRKRTRSSSRHLSMEEQQESLQQSPTKTLEPPEPGSEPGLQPDQEHQEIGMPTSPPPPFNQDIDRDQSVHYPPSTTKKATAKKKKPVAFRRRAAIEGKLASLKEQLLPVAFVPNKTVDFSKHEMVFKRLGLWDFAHLEFDQEIRSDLLALFIAGFDRNQRSSVINGARIRVSRADFARALKLQLPAKKDKNPAPETLDSDSVSEGFSEEALSVLIDFISNWFLLHEDTWMMPEEIVAAERFVKEGEPQKVDWSNLIWIMAEKELSQGPKLKNCFYASHFQLLMKRQRPAIFVEEEEEEEETQPPAICEEKEDEAVEVSVDEEDGAGRIKALEELQSQGNVEEEKNTELSLGQEKMRSPLNEEEQRVVVDEEEQRVIVDEEEQRVIVDEEEQRVVVDEEDMNVDDCKEQCQWFLDGNKNAGDTANGSAPTDHCFRPCSMNEPVSRDCDHESKPSEFDPPSSKFPQLDRLNSVDLMSAMDNNCNISFSPHGHLIDPSPSELFLSRGGVPTSSSNPNLTTFRNSFKREFDGHFSDGDPQKKMRNDGPWEFDSCMENIHNLMGKARMMYMEKEQSHANTLQHFAEEIQRRDLVIEALQRNRFEEQRKMSAELQKVSLELYVTTNLLQGYKRAYEETRDGFSEYRKQYQLPDEPVYRDIPGTGGLVLSETDFAKLQLERQEEDRVCRCAIEEQIKCFEHDWNSRFEALLVRVSSLGERVVGCEQEFVVIKGRLQTSRIPELE